MENYPRWIRANPISKSKNMKPPPASPILQRGFLGTKGPTITISSMLPISSLNGARPMIPVTAQLEYTRNCPRILSRYLTQVGWYPLPKWLWLPYGSETPKKNTNHNTTHFLSDSWWPELAQQRITQLSVSIRKLCKLHLDLAAPEKPPSLHIETRLPL